MVTFVALRDLSPAQYERDAADWDGQAEGAGSYAEAFEKQVVTCLAEWEGLTGWLARQRAGEFASAFGDAPQRLRAVASALRHAASEFQAAQDLLAEALEEAERLGVVVTDSGHVVPLPDGPTPQSAARIEAKIARAVARATRADEALARSLSLLQESLAWEGDNPAVLSADEAADLLKRAAAGDASALAELRRHKDQFSDPYFAQELAKTLGAKGFTELPGQMVGNPPSPEAQEVLGLLSDTLASAADPDNPAWEVSGDSCRDFLSELREQGRASQSPGGDLPYDGYWALGQIMNAGDGRPPYSTEFLADVGNDMVAWDREHAGVRGWPYSAHPERFTAEPGPFNTRGVDPLAGLMHAAGSNPEGAQTVLLNDAGGTSSGNNLDYLLERDWPDQGDALGEAIESAADPTSDAPRNGDRIASQVVDVLGSEMRDHPGRSAESLSEMRDSVGRMLGDRIEDVNYSINGSDIGDVPGRFGHQDLACALEFATKDKAGYDALISAELGHTRQAIDEAAASGHIEDLEVAARNGSHALGAIVGARVDGMGDDARERDAQHSLLAGYSRKGLGLASVVTGPLAGVANLAADEVTGKVFELSAPNAGAHVREQEATYDDQAKTALKDMIARSAADHQLYDQGHSPEAWLADHPEKVPFLDEQGRVMDWDQLVRDQRVYASFDEWVQEQQAWSRGRSEAEDGYGEGGRWYTTERDKPKQP